MIEDYIKRPELLSRGGKTRDLKFLKQFRDDLRNHEPVTSKHWMNFLRQDYEFGEIPLRNIGFWNVLKHFLSSEAFLLVHDGFGFLSVISNWNAPEAFKWLLTDFSPHQRLHTLKGGLSQIVTRLQCELESKCQIKPNCKVKEIRWSASNKRFDVACEGGQSAQFDIVVLAMPPIALRRILIADSTGPLGHAADENWNKLVACSRPHRLAKIVLAYREPWWKHTPIPGAESGRVFTDLPMRQIHYFGPAWLAENGWSKKDAGDYSLLMVYNDSHYEAFWRTFHVHDKVYRSASKDSEHPLQTLGYRPEEITGDGFTFLGPARMTNPDARDGDEVRHRMEEKVRHQLRELHDYDVPMAIGGVYKDWSDEGGWHTWEPFVDVPEIKEVIVQPFMDDAGISVRPCGGKDRKDRRLPLYVCGEAYAWEQGWIEGALMTAERVVREISDEGFEGLEWFVDRESRGFADYMAAEFPGEIEPQKAPAV